ncbi:MAG: hypothetical protein ACP6IY_07740 [Promethearchaeia archaeon]
MEREAILMNIALLANILIEVFGQDPAFNRIDKKYEGNEIEMFFPSLGGSLKFTLVSNRSLFECRAEKPKNPISIITINVKKEKAIKIVSDIIRQPDNLKGLMFVALKLIMRKIKVKGSLRAAIKFCRCMMIGKNPLYKNKLLREKL